jgi:hypothetical protein
MFASNTHGSTTAETSMDSRDSGMVKNSIRGLLAGDLDGSG